MRVQCIFRDGCADRDLAGAILHAVGIGDIGRTFDCRQTMVACHAMPVRHAILYRLDVLVRQAEVFRHYLGQIQDVRGHRIGLVYR